MLWSEPDLGRICAVRTKLLMAIFLIVEVALLTVYFHDCVIAGCLALGAAWFVADGLWLWRNKPYSPKVMILFMWLWNAAALLLIVWDYTQGTLARNARLVL